MTLPVSHLRITTIVILIVNLIAAVIAMNITIIITISMFSSVVFGLLGPLPPATAD